MTVQAPPVASQRDHAYVNAIGAAPAHVPSVVTSAWPSVGVPVTVGGTLLTGAAPETTTAVTAEGLSEVPPASVAVATTRSVLPTSAEVGTYVVAVAPAMLAHAVPASLQRCH